MNLKNIIIDISKPNNGDNIEEFVSNTSFNVYVLPSSYAYNSNLSVLNNRIYDFTDYFVITDNRNGANFAIENSIGMSIYTNGTNNPSEYKNALYCIDCLKEMVDDTLVSSIRLLNASI